MTTDLSISKKFYSSWSLVSHIGVLRVLLYPINFSEPVFIKFDLHISELFKFLSSVFALLEDIKKFIITCI